MKHAGSVDILTAGVKEAGCGKAVEVEGQAERQGLAGLGMDGFSQPGKSHQSDFGHLQFAKAPEQLQLNFVSTHFRIDVLSMSTESNTR